MKKYKYIILAYILLTGVALVSPQIREALAWQKALKLSSISSYQEYVEDWPEGKHFKEALPRIDSFQWQLANSFNTEVAFQKYLNNQPKGKYFDNAHQALDSIAWYSTNENASIRSLQTFIEIHLKSSFIEEAKSLQDQLKKDISIFKKANKANTSAVMENFLREFPGHIREATAKKRLKQLKREEKIKRKDREGRNIVDLIEEGKIEAEVSGSGINNVSVRIKKLVDHDINVKIPVGTFFVCNGYAQNMFGTSAESVLLNNKNWNIISIPAACANRTRDIPYGDERFSIRKTSFQQELQKLADAIQAGSLDYAVKQAAVWIVTDNADYDDLGILVSSSSPYGGGPRVIDEDDTVTAMKLCHQAGVNIKHKAIWQDKNKILEGIDNSKLKKWLKNF